MVGFVDKTVKRVNQVKKLTELVTLMINTLKYFKEGFIKIYPEYNEKITEKQVDDTASDTSSTDTNIITNNINEEDYENTERNTQ